MTFKLHVGHSRSLVLVPVDRLHSDFLFVYVGMLGNKSGSSTHNCMSRTHVHVTIDLNNCHLFQSVYLLSRSTSVMNDAIKCVTLLRVLTRVHMNLPRFDRNYNFGRL